MYSLTGVEHELIFTFENDGSILDAQNKKLGSVINGAVCDLDGTPARVTVEGDAIVWHGVNPGPVLRVTGSVVVQVDGNTPQAIVVGAKNHAERMIAAAAYWQFVWSMT
jgi:hypothetical protein